MCYIVASFPGTQNIERGMPCTHCSCMREISLESVGLDLRWRMGGGQSCL